MNLKEQSDKLESVKEQNAPAPKRPNDVGALQIDGFVKVFDPNSNEVYVEKRA